VLATPISSDIEDAWWISNGRFWARRVRGSAMPSASVKTIFNGMRRAVAGNAMHLSSTIPFASAVAGRLAGVGLW